MKFRNIVKWNVGHGKEIELSENRYSIKVYHSWYGCQPQDKSARNIIIIVLIADAWKLVDDFMLI